MPGHKAIAAIIVLIYLVGSLVFLNHRPIDGDEGYYASAIRLVAEGQRPYSDFFYPQTPLLPYLYVPAYVVVGFSPVGSSLIGSSLIGSSPVGSSLAGLRVLSVLLSGFALGIWWLALRRLFPNHPRQALAGLLLLALNPYCFVWSMTIKSYAAANFLVILALWSWLKGQQDGRWWAFGILGLSLGMLLGVRLLYGPWVAFVFLFLFGEAVRSTEKGLRNLAHGLWGCLLGLLPTLWFMSHDLDAFLFNNIRYHQLRHQPLKAEIDPVSPLDRILENFAVMGQSLLQNLFMVLLLGLALWGLWRWLRQKNTPPHQGLLFLAGGLVVMMAASLVPYPAHEQYFTVPLAPFLTPLALAGIWALPKISRGRGRMAAPLMAAPIMAALVMAAALSAADLGIRHAGMDMSPTWSMARLAKVSAQIEALTEPDDIVCAFWPGYTFAAGRRFLPGSENHFGIEISERLTIEEKVKYKILSKEYLLDVVENERVDMIVLGTWMNGLNNGIHQHHLPVLLDAMKEHYRAVWTLDDVELCLRR